MNILVEFKIMGPIIVPISYPCKKIKLANRVFLQELSPVRFLIDRSLQLGTLQLEQHFCTAKITEPSAYLVSRFIATWNGIVFHYIFKYFITHVATHYL